MYLSFFFRNQQIIFGSCVFMAGWQHQLICWYSKCVLTVSVKGLYFAQLCTLMPTAHVSYLQRTCGMWCVVHTGACWDFTLHGCFMAARQVTAFVECNPSYSLRLIKAPGSSWSRRDELVQMFRCTVFAGSRWHVSFFHFEVNCLLITLRLPRFFT